MKSKGLIMVVVFAALLMIVASWSAGARHYEPSWQNVADYNQLAMELPGAGALLSSFKDTAYPWLRIDLLFKAFIIAAFGFAFMVFLKQARKDPDSVFIRRIPGIDAIEEAVGRSTEMGRPVLYYTGTQEFQNIQTIASLLILGKVSEMVADYDTEMKTVNYQPITMVAAEEMVREGFAKAGRMDAHKPENVMFISSEQFACAAGINGIILRDKPACNIYLGGFFAESLILAETGYLTGAIQIAGTAEKAQLPFFIAACDYTLIGEELYAVSAYMAREPGLLGMLKATDFVKAGVVVFMILAATLTGLSASGYEWAEAINPVNLL